MELNVIDIPTVDEISEVALNQRMLNGATSVIWFEVLFGYIRLMLGSMR